MARHLRSLARRLCGVTRPWTYYLPWILRPGLECTLVLSNVEARSDGHDDTATHGRGEFIEGYPALARALMTAAGALAGIIGRTLPIFTRNQFVYLGPESRSHVLLMNLSNVANHIRATAFAGERRLGSRLLRLPPMGSHLLDVASLGPAPASGTTVWRLSLEGNT